MGTDGRLRLGRRLFDRRKSLGLTRETVAVRAGLGSATVRRIENGEHDPRLGTLEAIATVLDTTASRLLVDEPEEAA